MPASAIAARTPAATISTCARRPRCSAGSAGVCARPIASAGPFRSSPSARSNTVQCGAMPPSVPPDITRQIFAACSAGRCRWNSRLSAKRRVAAREIVDEAVALGLAEDRHDAFRIDAACGDRGLDAADVVGRGGGNAMDLGDRHGELSAARRVGSIMAGDRALELAQRRGERSVLRHAGAQARQQLVAHRRVVDRRAPAPSRTTVRPRDDQLVDVAHGGAREQEIAADRDRRAAARCRPRPSRAPGYRPARRARAHRRRPCW